jgi:hypothetical protein
VTVRGEEETRSSEGESECNSIERQEQLGTVAPCGRLHSNGCRSLSWPLDKNSCLGGFWVDGLRVVRTLVWVGDAISFYDYGL